MNKKYKIDLGEIEERRREKEYDEFINNLYKLMISLDPVDLSDYEIDEDRYMLLNSTFKLVSESFIDSECDIECSVSNSGLMGTIKITCEHLIPTDYSLFKGAVLVSDSFEISSYLDGHVEINLTFFDMLKNAYDEVKMK